MKDLTLAETIVGRSWLSAILVFWSLGVTSAAIPVVFKRPLRFALPGLLAVVSLGLIRPGPRALHVLALAIVANALFVMPPLWLIGLNDKGNERRAMWFLTVCATLFACTFLLSGDAVFIVMVLFTPLLLFAVPIALVVIGQSHLRANTWLSGVVSATSFSCGWIAWMSFNHFNP